LGLERRAAGRSEVAEADVADWADAYDTDCFVWCQYRP
jgi:hypothetical protein